MSWYDPLISLLLLLVLLAEVRDRRALGAAVAALVLGALLTSQGFAAAVFLRDTGSIWR